MSPHGPVNGEPPAVRWARRPGIRHVVWGTLILAACIGLLGYLRDPPWLLDYSSGLRGWETAADGARVRWAGAHASFFVPSDAKAVQLRLRTAFDRPGDWPMTVSVALDDVPAERVALSDSTWRTVTIRLPPGTTRRVRRLDLRADRARDGNRAFALGEVTLDPPR